MEFVGSVCCLWVGFVQVALLAVAVSWQRDGLEDLTKRKEDERGGDRKVGSQREWKFPSTPPAGYTGDTKTAILLEAGFAPLQGRGDTPGSAELLLIASFLLL